MTEIKMTKTSWACPEGDLLSWKFTCQKVLGQNSKYECRNSKQIQMTEIQMTETNWIFLHKFH